MASSFPAAVTLPAEMGITMTPRMMTTLQLSASFGEMFCPFLMGVAFQYGRYAAKRERSASEAQALAKPTKAARPWRRGCVALAL